MLFTSFEFIAFMAVVFLAYYLVPKKAQWPLLLVASYIFYWCADPMYLLFIGVTTVSTYAVSRLLEKVNAEQKAYLQAHKAELDKEQKKAYKAKMKAKKWHLLLLCLIFNLGILSVTKYTNFVITNINSFLSGNSKLALVDMIVPLGISFYTFQSMGYIIDVYRDKQAAQKNFFKLALFVSFSHSWRRALSVAMASFPRPFMIPIPLNARRFPMALCASCGATSRK
jgi:D-alanyl-lipoteichoic acid acyltransferase DltB (MBOAT superfamily)